MVYREAMPWTRIKTMYTGMALIIKLGSFNSFLPNLKAEVFAFQAYLGVGGN